MDTRCFVIVILFVSLFLGSLSAAPIPKDLKPEYPMDGTWERISYQNNGRNKILDQPGRHYYWQIDKESLKAYRENSTSRSEIQLEFPKTNRRQKAFVYNLRTIRRPGIYEIDGDRLKIAMSQKNNGERPELCQPGEGITYYEFRRVQDPKR